MKNRYVPGDWVWVKWGREWSQARVLDLFDDGSIMVHGWRTERMGWWAQRRRLRPVNEGRRSHEADR